MPVRPWWLAKFAIFTDIAQICNCFVIFLCNLYKIVVRPMASHWYCCWTILAGIQASLWGEMVRTMDQIEYMLYPRLLSVAERAWHVADWETTAVDRVDFDRRRRTDWRRFASVVGRVELRRLERMGVRYRVPPPGVRYCICDVLKYAVLAKSSYCFLLCVHMGVYYSINVRDV